MDEASVWHKTYFSITNQLQDTIWGKCEQRIQQRVSLDKTSLCYTPGRILTEMVMKIRGNLILQVIEEKDNE